MKTNLTSMIQTTVRLTVIGLAGLAAGTRAAAAAGAGEAASTRSPDHVGIVILTILLGGICIAVLAAMIDRLQTVCHAALRLVEIALRERPNTPPTAGLNDGIPPLPATPPQGAGPATSAPQVPARADTPEPKRRAFRVELAKDLLPKIHDYITGFLARHGTHNEAGGMFVGEYLPDEPTGEATFKIRGFIEAGPAADFSSGSILFDTAFQTSALRALQTEHPAAANIGCIHRHPGSLDVCSGGDLAADREAVAASGTRALVFGIITLNNPRRLPSSLFYRNCKIDFYLLAEETGPDYQPILPVLADLPLLEASPAVTELHALRGPEVGFDLAVLKQLPGLVQAALSRLESAAGVLLTARFADLGQPLQIWVQPDGALRLFHQAKDGSRGELNGPWTQAGVGNHIWLSQLLLKARAALCPPPPPSYPCHFGLLEDKFRLVAEARAMQERYGNRAVLRRRDGRVFWEYTVHESGRAFPIEIRYPDNYPSQPPQIHSVRRLPHCPHRLGDHDPCWIDYLATDWNPARDTAVICVHAAHKWFACLLVYLTLGHWPAGADH